jgi:hypothetical protein
MTVFLTHKFQIAMYAVSSSFRHLGGWDSRFSDTNPDGFRIEPCRNDVT